MKIESADVDNAGPVSRTRSSQSAAPDEKRGSVSSAGMLHANAASAMFVQPALPSPAVRRQEAVKELMETWVSSHGQTVATTSSEDLQHIEAASSFIVDQYWDDAKKTVTDAQKMPALKSIVELVNSVQALLLKQDPLAARLALEKAIKAADEQIASALDSDRLKGNPITKNDPRYFLPIILKKQAQILLDGLKVDVNVKMVAVAGDMEAILNQRIPDKYAKVFTPDERQELLIALRTQKLQLVAKAKQQGIHYDMLKPLRLVYKLMQNPTAEGIKVLRLTYGSTAAPSRRIPGEIHSRVCKPVADRMETLSRLEKAGNTPENRAAIQKECEAIARELKPMLETQLK